MYYVFNSCDNLTYVFKDWLKLLVFFNHNSTLGQISHNEKDIDKEPIFFYDYDYHPPRIYKTGYKETLKAYTIYDEYGRIINKSEIILGLKKTDKYVLDMNTPDYYWHTGYTLLNPIKKKKRWNSRKPFYKTAWRKVKVNKKYFADFQEYLDIFPNESKMKKSYSCIGYWWDDFYRNKSKSWKDQSKKRKQWMKKN